MGQRLRNVHNISVAYSHLQTSVSDNVLVTALEELCDFVLVITYVSLEAPVEVLCLENVYIYVCLDTGIGH